MTNEQLIVKFNPANAASITPDDLKIMHELTDEQIDILAEAYPNQPSRKSYLRLYDQNLKPDKQLYQLSTWQNLRNVRKFSQKRNLIAYDFYQVVKPQPRQAVTKVTPGKPQKIVVDMTAQEAADELRKSIKATVTDKVKQKELIKTVNSVERSALKAVEKAAENVEADQQFDDATK